MVACTPNGDNQPAPKWTGYSGNADLAAVSGNLNQEVSTSSVYTVGYDQARAEFIGKNDFLIKNSTNLKVLDAGGKDVDYINTRLYPGTYYLYKIDIAKPWGFKFVNTESEIYNPISVNMVFARPAK